MLKNLFLAGLAAAVVAGVGYANQPIAKTVIIPVSKVPANNGKQMYVNYCAPCHGVDGKGNGPVAAALKTAAHRPGRVEQKPRREVSLDSHRFSAAVRHCASSARLGRNAAVGTRAWVWGFRSERNRRDERSGSTT